MSKFAGREEAVEPECNFESASTSTTSTSTAAAAAGEGDVGFASIATTSVAASAGDTSSSDAARAAEVVDDQPPSPRAGGAGAADDTASSTGTDHKGYDPREFQEAHPADRFSSTPSKFHYSEVLKGAAESEGGDAEGSAEQDGVANCANCNKAGATKTCTQCQQEVYCDPECQKVSRRPPLPSTRVGGSPAPPPRCPPTSPPPTYTQEHWHYGGHKKACRAHVVATAAQAQHDRLVRIALEAESCMICLEVPTDPTTLPCGHSFCAACVLQLREQGVSETCPLCRAPLPPGMEKLFELAMRVVARLDKAVGRSDQSWAPLSPTQQAEWDDSILLLQEATDQGHVHAAEFGRSAWCWHNHL